MNGLLAAVALAGVQPVIEPPSDNEIEVVANRLRKWRGTWRVRDSAVTCKTRRSTGDTAIDAIGCDAMVQCMAPIAQRFDLIQNAGLNRAQTQQQINALLESEKIGDCLATRREAGIAALLAARRSSRT